MSCDAINCVSVRNVKNFLAFFTYCIVSLGKFASFNIQVKIEGIVQNGSNFVTIAFSSKGKI